MTGAGFSLNAGLPLANEFSTELVNINGLKLDGPSNILAQFLRGFISDIFGHGSRTKASEWPTLEDVFTFVDISANSGHHLGKTWSASDLRVVRRALIVRSMRMLTRSYNIRAKAPSNSFKLLNRFIRSVDIENSSFLSMNWDTVLERRFLTLRGLDNFDYGCSAFPAKFERRKGGNLVEEPASGDSVRIVKPHGSFNWVYCDICRRTFWVKPHQVLKVANQLFRRNDWQVVTKRIGRRLPYIPSYSNCPRCDANGLGTRLATFSYKKALEFPMYTASWRTAELALAEAENWVFIGYSLPAADYEFKLMLKRVQLSRAKPPKVIVIAKGGDTFENYKRLFGSAIEGGSIIQLEEGLTTAAIDRLVLERSLL